MSDSTIPPKTSSLLTSSVSSGKSAVPAASPVRMVVNDAPVRHAPAGLREHKEGRPERLEGRVTSYDREKRELRVTTKQGEITVKSETPLPPGEEVIIELYTRNGAELARIMLLKQQAVMAQEAAQLVQAQDSKAPPLKSGDTVTALLMHDDRAEPPVQGQPVQPNLQRVALILEQLTAADLQRLPQPLPVPPDVAAKLAMTDDLFKALQQLPPEQQQKVIAYIARTDVLAKLQTMLPPQTLAGLTTPSDPADENIEQFIRGLAAPKTFLQTVKDVQSTPAPPQTGVGALKGLMPLLEALQSPGIGAGGIMPRMAGSPSSTMLAELLPQNMYSLKIVSVTPPNTPPPPAPAAPVQQGEVEFITTAGFPVVKAGEQHYILRTPAAIDIGSIVQFEPSPMTTQQIMATVTPPAAAAGFAPLWSATWPALQDALQTAPPAVTTTLENTIPSPTPRLVPTVLFFLAALRMGGVERWLGPAALQNLRETGKSSIAERLTGDFGKISAQSKETVAGEWRAISMPLLHDGEISQMQFFLRQQQEKDGGDKQDGKRDPDPTRFILNLHLSRMGDMQLDGLLRPQTFDLILRSAEALPLTMRQELMQSFAKGLSQAEMQGGISFQTRGEKWVTIDLPQQGTVA